MTYVAGLSNGSQGAGRTYVEYRSGATAVQVSEAVALRRLDGEGEEGAPRVRRSRDEFHVFAEESCSPALEEVSLGLFLPSSIQGDAERHKMMKLGARLILLEGLAENLCDLNEQKGYNFGKKRDGGRTSYISSLIDPWKSAFTRSIALSSPVGRPTSFFPSAVTTSLLGAILHSHVKTIKK